MNRGAVSHVPNTRGKSRVATFHLLLMIGRMDRRKFLGFSAAAISSVKVHAADRTDHPATLRFGLITDVQYADAEPEGERHYRHSLEKLTDAAHWLAKRELPFTLHLGDFIDRDHASFSKVLPLLKPLGHPVHHLLGNHDFTIEEHLKSQVPSLLGMPHEYYSLTPAGMRIVMLDTNDRSIYKTPAGNPAALEAKRHLASLKSANLPNAKPWNGGLSSRQLEWLDGELVSAAAEKQRAIICSHHPLLPVDEFSAWDQNQVVDLIDRHRCVIASFSGHQHGGAEIVRNGIPYITFKSILHEPGVNAYSQISIFADRLEILGNGREISRPFAIPKIGVG